MPNVREVCEQTNSRAIGYCADRFSTAELGMEVPVIPNIHQEVERVTSTPGALNMSVWHNTCGTTHCVAGWVVTLAGEAGKKLEKALGCELAARLIYSASDPSIRTTDDIPRFTASGSDALAAVKRLAWAERERANGETK